MGNGFLDGGVQLTSDQAAFSFRNVAYAGAQLHLALFLLSFSRRIPLLHCADHTLGGSLFFSQEYTQRTREMEAVVFPLLGLFMYA